MNNLARVILISIFTFASLCMYSQVNNIKENIQKDKANKQYTTNKKVKSKKTYNSNEEFNVFDDVFIFFVKITFGGLYHIGKEAQISALNNHDEFNQRISFEIQNSFGKDRNEKVNYFKTGARINWGIFASDFKYTNLYDITNLKSIDWLVGIVRLPIKNLNFEYGIGFINIPELSKSYFKSSIGMEWNLKRPSLSLSTSYHWSQKTTLGSRYNQSANFKVDYTLFSFKKVHFNPMIEYSYQNYFNENHYDIFNIGLIVKIY